MKNPFFIQFLDLQTWNITEELSSGKIRGINKIDLKTDCIAGIILNGAKQPMIYSFGLDKPLGHEITKNLKLNTMRQ